MTNNLNWLGGNCMRRRVLTVILITVMFSTMVLGGCTPQPKTEPETANRNSSSKEDIKDGKEDDKVTEPGTFPIVKEKVTLSALGRQAYNTSDLETNEFTKWYEDKTNVHIDWIQVPDKEATEKLNVLMAGGNYPEIILNGSFSNAQQLLYGQQGIFQPLNDLIEEYGFYVSKAFDEYETVKDDLILPDGNIYSLPIINDVYHGSAGQKMWIYMPWLEKLDLEMPTNTEEFYQVLKAFKTDDPNENGKKDEIPLAGAITGPQTGIDGFIMCAFIYNDMENRLIVEKGKIDAVYNKPEWREGLRYMHKLYKEELLAPESFTQDRDQFQQMGENPEVVLLGAASSLFPGVFTEVSLASPSGRWLEYKSVPPLKGPDGCQITRYSPVRGNSHFTITDKCKDPEIAFRWADGFYEEEVTLRNVEGRKGIEWDWAEEGEVGINGKTAIWKFLADERGDNVTWSQRCPSFRSSDFRLGEAVEPGVPHLEVILYEETKKNYMPYIPELDMLVPPLTFSEEQSAELVELQTTINDFVGEMIARFTTGDADIETDWDAYLKELEKMKIERYLEIYQEAYDSK